jgi:hypothetical protein
MIKNDLPTYEISAQLLQEIVNILQELPAKTSFKTIQSILEIAKKAEMPEAPKSSD